MSELDYQMALLLQHKFEQEHRSSSTHEHADLEYARALQEQFEHESALENPSGSLVYKKKTNPNRSKSLTDPSWELVDPTPDIHILFVAFNEKFFWNKLLAVCVSWSKRMTSCAGVCSYSGRGGLCSITLSEPLLKLRPRKDLVETLLHEMIHAYLFVTDNNRDRDGHGPEFHKHMFRINKEAGTNITVYHDFHDEVRLYQQHWWRCDGPCQTRRPYFGMVRRATNRAPGPNDRWFEEHTRTCGGTFIKVKEPEKTGNKKKSPPEKPKNDIRKYIPTVVKNVTKGQTNVGPSTSSSNIIGFKDLTNVQIKGRSNSSSTITITNSQNNQTTSYKPTVLNKDSQKAPPAKGDSCTNDFISVRNHWQSKFGAASTSSKKRPSNEAPAAASSSSKIPKISDLVECPVCRKMFEYQALDQHLNLCLVETDNKAKECPICKKQVSSDVFDRHVQDCLLKVYDDVAETLDGDSTVSCLACDKKILKKDLDAHLEDCMNMSGIFADDLGEEGDVKRYNCPFCLALFAEDEMKAHIDGCLDIADCLD